MLSGFSFNSPRQARVHRMLSELIGPGPAAAYCDACCLRQEQRFLTTVHLVSHLHREIDGSILDVISPTALRASKGGDKRREKIEAICSLLKIPAENTLMERWSNLQLSGLAHRKNLSRRHIDDAFLQECDHYDAILDTVLTEFASQFRITMTRVDTLLAISSPSNDDVRSLLVAIPNQRAVFEHVFDRDLSAGWKEALLRRKFFVDPPEHALVPALRFATIIAESDTPVAVAIAEALWKITDVEGAREFLILLVALPKPRAADQAIKVIQWLESLGRPLSDTEQAILGKQLGDFMAYIAVDASWEVIERLTIFLTGFTEREHLESQADDFDNE